MKKGSFILCVAIGILFLSGSAIAEKPDCGPFLAAFRGGDGFGIYRFDPPEYQPRLLVKGFGPRGWCNMPRVSHDFKTLYFTTNSPDNTAKLLARLDLEKTGSKPEMLPLGQESKPRADFVYAAPHPSGKWLVSSMRLDPDSGNHDLFRLDLDGGTEGVTIRDFLYSPAWEGLPAFSPDGRSIAFIQSATLDPGTYEDSPSSKAQQLVLAPVTKGRKAGPSRVLFKAPRFVEMPQWSPDGKSIVIQVNAWDGDYDIVKVDAESGKWEVITTSPYDDYNPTYTADGKWILFAQKPSLKTEKREKDSLGPLSPGSNRVLCIPAEGGSPQKLFEARRGYLWFPQALK